MNLEEWKATLMRQAFQMKKDTGLKLGQCYEQIAKNLGYNTYAAYRAAMKEKLK